MPIKHPTTYRRIFIALLALFPLVCAKLSPEDQATGQTHDYTGAIIITVVILAIGFFIEKWSRGKAPTRPDA